MAEKLTEKINRIIKQSDIEDKKLEKLYLDVFREMVSLQEQKQSDVEQIVKRELQAKNYNWNDRWEIRTLLCKDRDEEYWIERNMAKIDIGDSIIYSLSPFASEAVEYDEDYNKQHIFLNVAYDEVDNLCQRNYEGYFINDDGTKEIFHYRLQQHDRFKLVEDKLYEMSEMYGINRPIVYSPYARRAVDICLATNDVDKFKIARESGKINYKLEDNGLEGKLILDKILMWNVVKSDNHIDLACKESLLPNQLEYHYKTFEGDIGPEDFIYTHVNVEKIYKDENGIVIYTREALEENECSKITINHIDENSNYMFLNYYDMDRVNFCSNIRTKADVNYILSRFNTDQYQCELGNDVGQKRIPRYRKELAYHQNKNELYYTYGKCKPVLLVRFSGNDSYKIDFCNYVLAFLEGAYPSFTWVGVE